MRVLGGPRGGIIYLRRTPRSGWRPRLHRAPTCGSVRSRIEGSDRIFISALLIAVEDSNSHPRRTAPENLRTAETRASSSWESGG